MTSFFEKLKKGMGIEEPIIKEESEEEKKRMAKSTIETKTSKKPKKSPKQSFRDAPGQAKTKKAPKEDKTAEIKKIEIQTKMPEEKESSFAKASEDKEEIEKQKEKKWPSFNKEEEGQLAIDVYQTENDLVIQSAIAGVKPENLDISIERDIIAIKGSREKPGLEEEGDYFSQECFWGHFSREVILPAEVDPERAAAEMKNGILIIRIPKILREKKRKIVVRE